MQSLHDRKCIAVDHYVCAFFMELMRILTMYDTFTRSLFCENGDSLWIDSNGSKPSIEGALTHQWCIISLIFAWSMSIVCIAVFICVSYLISTFNTCQFYTYPCFSFLSVWNFNILAGDRNIMEADPHATRLNINQDTTSYSHTISVHDEE